MAAQAWCGNWQAAADQDGSSSCSAHAELASTAAANVLCAQQPGLTCTAQWEPPPLPPPPAPQQRPTGKRVSAMPRQPPPLLLHPSTHLYHAAALSHLAAACCRECRAAGCCQAGRRQAAGLAGRRCAAGAARTGRLRELGDGGHGFAAASTPGRRCAPQLTEGRCWTVVSVAMGTMGHPFWCLASRTPRVGSCMHCGPTRRAPNAHCVTTVKSVHQVSAEGQCKRA